MMYQSAAVRSLVTTFLLALPATITVVEAHGGLTHPVSRNYRASSQVDGKTIWTCDNASPKIDYNWPALNENESTLGSGIATSACGITQRETGEVFDYDHPVNCDGGRLAWQSQATYAPGEEFEVKVQLTAHHEGFFEFFVCPQVGSPTNDCFDSYPLEYVRDPLYGAPKDLAYPTRAYVPPASYYDGATHEYIVKMPDNAPTGNVLLQWRYTTGNTCAPNDGYLEHYNSLWGGAASSIYGSLPACGMNYPFEPLPDTRENIQKVPERFWNCAEVSISSDGNSGGSDPTSSPTKASPVPAPSQAPTTRPNLRPTASPVQQPVEVSPTDSPVSSCCAAGFTGSVAANDCTGFVQCQDGVEFPFQECQSGLKFLETGTGNGYCDYASNVVCATSCDAGSGGSTIPATTPAPSTNAPTSAPVGTTTASPTSSNSSGNNHGKSCCADGFTGLVAVKDCGGYVQCVNGVEYPFVTCPSGLKFNQDQAVCDYADNVVCESTCTPSDN